MGIGGTCEELKVDAGFKLVAVDRFEFSGWIIFKIGFESGGGGWSVGTKLSDWGTCVLKICGFT